MKVILSLFALIFIGQAKAAFCLQSSGHKSEAEIARMTPEQRVEESCREYARHKYQMCDYQDLLESYIGRDGIKSVPEIIKVINEYDPTRREGRSKEKDLRCENAQMLLSFLDTGVFRLRAVEEGRKALEAVKRLIERMRAADFDSLDTYEYNKQGRYQNSLLSIKEMEGINYCDEAIRNTLKHKYNILLSDQKMLDFVNYLISQDAYYPGWSKRDWYRDPNRLNEKGFPLRYVRIINLDPFYQAYLKYKAKDK